MEPARAAPPDPGPVLLPAALCCASALGLQVVLPRLFSVLLWYHLGFLAVSLALLGFAAAGAIVARRGPLRLRTACAASALAVPLGAALAVRVPLDLQDVSSLLTTLTAPLMLLLMGVLFAVPFTALGLAAASALQWRRERPGAVWGACFLGGAAGAAFALVAMDAWGAPVALLLLAVPPLLGSLLPSAVASRPGVMACALAAAALAGAGLRAPDELLPLRSRKHFPRVPPEAVRAEPWNAFSRVTFYDNPEHHGLWAVSPAYTGELPDSIGVAIDSWAITSILKRAPGVDADPVLPFYPPTLAYVGAQPGFSALVIGAGGGVDVQAALAAGAGHVTAVEINDLIVDAVLGPYAEWSGDLYRDPRVEVVVAEGRHFLRTARDTAGAPRRWDRIVLSGVDTFAATEAGAFALSEDQLYTVEALRDLLAHLSPDGLAFFTRWWFQPPRQTLRLALTAAQVLRERGVADPISHLFIARTDMFGGESGDNSLLLVGAAPLPPAQVQQLLAATAARSCVPVLAPATPSYPIYVEALSLPDPAPFLARYEYRVEPVTDDRPFFFEYGRLTHLFRTEGDPIRDRLGGQELLVATLLVLLVLAGPLLLAAPPPRGAAGFAALGIGYALVELALMQRFTLLLGHPVHAVAIVLASFLVFSGLGALLSARAPASRASLAALVAAVAIAVAALGAGLLDKVLIGAPFAARAAGVAALISLPGLAAGLPFPLAVRSVAGERAAGAFLWNGVASVIAAPLAIMLAMEAGFLVVLFAGAACYVAAAAWLRG
jgi:hypothetical protein